MSDSSFQIVMRFYSFCTFSRIGVPDDYFVFDRVLGRGDTAAIRDVIFARGLDHFTR
jgi:hypothetical protein